jgi:hypothetical protein
MAAIDKKSGKKWPLLRTILHSSGTHLLVPIIPRLLLSGLRFAQPFLVANAVDWAGDKDASSNIGYGLIGAFALVYIGLGVSCAGPSQHIANLPTRSLRLATNITCTDGLSRSVAT